MSDRRLLSTLTAITLALMAHNSAIADDNDDLTIKIAALIGTHNVALPISFVTDPFVGIPASAVTFGTNLGLKDTRAVFYTPDDWQDDPNSDNRCTYDFDLPQSVAEYSNLLGFIDLRQIPEQWGDLTRFGPPVQVVHANTDVTVSVSNEHILPDQLHKECPPFSNACTILPPQAISLPSGRHTMTWRADTQINDTFDIIVPAVLLGFNAGYYGASWANQGASATRQLAIRNQATLGLIDWIAEIAGLADNVGNILDTRTTVTHEREQEITIWKRVPPEISTTAPVITLEATDFGGVLYNRVASELRATINASDPCLKPFVVGNDAGPLLAIGSNTLTWTVRDTGPLPGGGFNSDSVIQRVNVQDTQGPIMVPPPSRVIEVPGGASGLNASQVSLGAPRVVDLADPEPVISNDGPTFYPVNSRSPITWTATDQSGNASNADQLITIKVAGENTAPSVNDLSASTLTSEPIDVVLRGSDPDFIGGRFDPLSFRISDRPDNGEFVAPLYPFFIEDYRTSPGGPYGEGFYLASPRSGWLNDNVCKVASGPNSEKIRVDWVYEPEFVIVDDDGKVYLFDRFWQCQSSGPVSRPRISTWDRDGNFIGQLPYSSDNDNANQAFVLDPDGFLYDFRVIGSGSSAEIVVNRCATDFEGKASRSEFCESLGSVNSSSAQLLATGSVSYARVDSREDLLFVTDKERIFVFDIRNDPPSPIYLTALNLDDPLPTPSPSCAGSSRLGYAIEFDADSNLYMVNCANERIEKFTRSYFDDEGNFVPGTYVGWMGRCTSSTNNACDEVKEISRGFACTDATCTRGDLAGEEPGQFDTPLYIAVDPNDVLYVAEWGNARVQRFSRDGTFAGQAQSTGTGVNQGEQPGFVLGNMGRPRAVSVNSTQFYVVDREEGFLHVFETSPLKDITDSSATVTYVSNFDFHSDTDSFQYLASDGLANSNPGTVTIDVSRNFRPPVTEDLAVSTLENAAVDIILTAEDLDGIAGVDFNGLDRLTFRVLEPPANGTFQPIGSDDESLTIRYTPDPGFSGQDLFSFVANDGVDDSNESLVTIDVSYVDDPPVITAIELPDRIGLGFPFLVRGVFEDDGAANPDNYFTAIVWTSDGQTETVVEGGINEDDPNRPFIEQILLIRPFQGRGTGYGIDEQLYTTAGSKSVRFCILDTNAGDTPCQDRAFEVEPLVNLTIELPDDLDETPPPTAPFGKNFTVEVVIGNLQPEGVPGMVAQSISLEGTIATPGIRFVSSSLGDCSISGGGQTINCDFGDFNPGEQRTVTLTLTSVSGDPDDFGADIGLSVTTTSEAVNEVTEVYLVREVGGTRLFRNGFEVP